MTKTLFNRRDWLCGFSTAAALLTAKPAFAADGLEHYVETSPPQPLSDLKFSTESGEAQTLENYRGRILLVNIWATWCVPCVLEMPSLDKLQQTLGGAQFAVLPISTDRGGAEKVRRFYSEKGITHLPVLTDREMSVPRRIRPRGLPLSLLVNHEGMEIGRSNGDEDWASPGALGLIRKAIAGY
jgi:thiol-disulfide isomerase/thioredoxin